MERLKIIEPLTAPKTTAYLNEELIEEFCKLVRRGLPADGVCDYLSISTTAFWNWVRKGTAYIDGAGEPADYIMYGLFVQEFRKATAELRLNHIDKMNAPESASHKWIREMAILERRDRKTFSRTDPAGGVDDSVNPDEKFL